MNYFDLIICKSAWISWFTEWSLRLEGRAVKGSPPWGWGLWTWGLWTWKEHQGVTRTRKCIRSSRSVLYKEPQWLPLPRFHFPNQPRGIGSTGHRMFLEIFSVCKHLAVCQSWCLEAEPGSCTSCFSQVTNLHYVVQISCALSVKTQFLLLLSGRRKREKEKRERRPHSMPLFPSSSLSSVCASVTCPLHRTFRISSPAFPAMLPCHTP